MANAPLLEDDIWQGFQISDEENVSDSVGSVAEDVLEAFGIELKGNGGGSLEGIDIKRGDALSILKASLLETYATSASSKLQEVRINPEGKAEIYYVGEDSSSLSPYYSISSSTYIKDPTKVSVMVTGKKPKQTRQVYEWYPLIGDGASGYSIYDTTKLSTACLINSFSTLVTITYTDPFRNNVNTNWNNGVPDIFEPSSPYERFIGFTWKIVPPADLVSPYTKIYKQSQSSIPVILSDPEYQIGATGGFPNLGIPVRRATYVEEAPGESNCKAFEGDVAYCGETTVPIPIAMAEGLTYEMVRGKPVSKFIGVTGVFTVGIPLVACYGTPLPGKQKEENNAANTSLFIASTSAHNTLTKLSEGTHYVLLYQETPDAANIGGEDDPSQHLPCIQFANNLRYNDFAEIGTGKSFFIGNFARELITKFNDAPTGTGSVLAFENRSGVLVNQLWAQISLDTPCFIVNDSEGGAKAKQIADRLKVSVLALSILDFPAPIAMNGVLIDQEQGIIDNDPTNPQNLIKTDMEEAYDQMSSGRTLSLSFASLDENSTKNLSEKLYELLLRDTGKTYTHTCGPTETPKVGDRGPKGGIVNTIEYSYTDQGSYLINVTEGPENFGDFSGINGGMYTKQVEEVTTKGTIIQDRGNHVDYLVRVDGYGDVHAINGCAEVLTVRDRVSITIHNNAVES
jgi:hypothetical protein